MRGVGGAPRWPCGELSGVLALSGALIGRVTGRVELCAELYGSCSICGAGRVSGGGPEVGWVKVRARVRMRARVQIGVEGQVCT